MERYGCMVGYLDSTFRGQRSFTRYEFAAGLNACFDRLNQQLANATANLVQTEDLQTLQRLQVENSRTCGERSAVTASPFEMFQCNRYE